MTKGELPVLRAQLQAERERTHDAARELAKLRGAIGDRAPNTVELMAAAGFLHNVSQPLAARVDEYRRFRHAFRHMYFFDLKWDQLAPLADGAPRLLRDFEGALDALLASLAG